LGRHIGGVLHTLGATGKDASTERPIANTLVRALTHFWHPTGQVWRGRYDYFAAAYSSLMAAEIRPRSLTS
jgi:hypothetical protein